MKKIDFENGNTKASAETMIELQDNIEEAIKDIGLGDVNLTMIRNEDINSIDLNGFCYLSACNYGEINLANGYLLQLVYISTYKVQFYISASGTTGLQYRKLVNGIWQSWMDI